ncbi:MAG: hypothetical protein IIB57_12460 [Planctomycetes bacterium]|nr:hypothetical protein [Planctomycetota bacterium]
MAAAYPDNRERDERAGNGDFRHAPLGRIVAVHARKSKGRPLRRIAPLQSPTLEWNTEGHDAKPDP